IAMRDERPLRCGLETAKWRRSSGLRERDPDVGAVVAIGSAGGAAVSLRDRLHDREAEPAAAAPSTLVGAAEAVERARGERRGEARALVGDVQLHPAVLRTRRELDRPGAVRERVRDEIAECLLDPGGIRVDDELVPGGAHHAAELTRLSGEPAGD